MWVPCSRLRSLVAVAQAMASSVLIDVRPHDCPLVHRLVSRPNHRYWPSCAASEAIDDLHKFVIGVNIPDAPPGMSFTRSICVDAVCAFFLPHSLSSMLTHLPLHTSLTSGMILIPITFHFCISWLCVRSCRRAAGCSPASVTTATRWTPK